MGTIPTEMTETDEMLAQNIHRFARQHHSLSINGWWEDYTIRGNVRVKTSKTLKTNNKNLKKKS